MQRTWTYRGARPLSRRCRAIRCSARASRTRRCSRALAVARGDGARLLARAARQPRRSRPHRLSDDLPAADPAARHRHRRDLEAHVQPGLRRHQPAPRRSSGSPGTTGSATAAGASRRWSSSTSGTGRRSCSCCCSPALESLPQDVYEAATIDGASAWQELRYVTLPMMLPTLVGDAGVPADRVVQGLRRGLSADRRRPRHRDRGAELHDLPPLLHRGPRWAMARRSRSSCCSSLDAADRAALAAPRAPAR